MKTGLAVTVIALVSIALSACSGAREEPFAPDTDAGSSESAEVPEETEAPVPQFEAATFGSGGSDFVSSTGYTGNLSFSWTAVKRIELSEAAEMLPACYEKVRAGLTGGATDASLYVYKITGSVTFPTVDGFTWPTEGSPSIVLETDYDPGFNAAHGQSVCGYDSTNGLLPLPAAPAGGTFEFYVEHSVAKIPNNPNGDFVGPLTMGINSYADPAELTSSTLSIAGGPLTCATACRFDLAAPLP